MDSEMAVSLFRPPDALTYDSLPDLVLKWRQWKKVFLIFMSASKSNAETSETKMDMLLNLIGFQGLELYESFVWSEAETKSYDSLLKKFDDHVDRNENVTINRFEFWSCNQQENQTLDDYIKDLKLLRRHCRFKEDENIEDTLLRDRIVYGIKDNSLREKILRLDPKKSTLGNVEEICRSHEISAHQAAKIDQKPEVNAISRNRYNYKPSAQMECPRNVSVNPVSSARVGMNPTNQDQRWYGENSLQMRRGYCNCCHRHEKGQADDSQQDDYQNVAANCIERDFYVN